MRSGRIIPYREYKIEQEEDEEIRVQDTLRDFMTHERLWVGSLCHVAPETVQTLFRDKRFGTVWIEGHAVPVIACDLVTVVYTAQPVSDSVVYAPSQNSASAYRLAPIEGASPKEHRIGRQVIEGGLATVLPVSIAEKLGASPFRGLVIEDRRLIGPYTVLGEPFENVDGVYFATSGLTATAGSVTFKFTSRGA